MTIFPRKAKCKILSIQILIVIVTLFLPPQLGAVRAQGTGTIQTVDLNPSIKEIARVEFGYHRSSFESQHIEYNLEVKDGVLTDGSVQAPLSSLAPLLSELKGMYPGTRPLYWESWSDDYPHAWIYLHLTDGRVIAISSDSQFDGMFPWNVLVWSSEKASKPDASYIQLNSTFLHGIDLLWQGVGEEGFPRKGYEESFWKDMFENSVTETVKFYNEDAAESAPILGDSPTSLALFLPLLKQNSEIKSLLDAGYSIFDAAFELEAKIKPLQPIQYSGTLALATPDRRDVVIGMVTLPLTEGQPVTTTLNAVSSMQLVEQRRASQFLNEAERILTPLTFLLDTRDGDLMYRIPTLDCPENRDISLDGKLIQAIWNPVQPMQIIFYPITRQRWSVNLGLQRGDPNWDDETVQTILESWFPEPIAALPIQDIQAVHSKWRIAFQPGVTLRDPQLLDQLASSLPDQTVIHEQNPEKAGDYGYLSLDGRIVLSENGAAPAVVYCGVTLPDWYRPAYSIEDVVPPNDQTPRQEITTSKNGEWLSLLGSLPREQFRTHWTDIAFTKPGFLHVLWTDEREGVYYTDGWIDGTGWSEPQRLGDDVYSVKIEAWPDGEIHLFWDAGSTTGGSVHVWRPAGGNWQKAEHWPVAYFGKVLRDINGTLHIGTFESDGLDSEFMYRTWSRENGLSAPENISRQIGNGGAGGILRLDSKGQLHAAWTHVLEQKSAPDPVTGETSDISGIFYARRLPNGRWTKPELIGTLAVYAHAMSMELDLEDQPLMVWQADSGLFSRTQKNEVWENPVELVKVLPPETPAEFGPDRWVRPTAKLQTSVNAKGQIIVGWLIPYSGLKLAFWSDTEWTSIVDVISTEESKEIDLEPLTLQMVTDDLDQVHFVFFKDNWLHYGLYDDKEVKIHSLSMVYDGYGLPEAKLLIDTTGSVAVLGLPRSPGFDMKIGSQGIVPTPMPTTTPLPMATPQSISTPQQDLKKNSAMIPLIIGLGILVMLLLAGISRAMFNSKQSD